MMSNKLTKLFRNNLSIKDSALNFRNETTEITTSAKISLHAFICLNIDIQARTKKRTKSFIMHDR